MLNLPETPSFSISLGQYGATTTLALSSSFSDEITLNGVFQTSDTVFYQRISHFLDLFRPVGVTYCVDSIMNLPVAAGLASSACGFAALVKALVGFYGWSISLTQQSILARLGSGSACRSFWQGFVEWQVGVLPDGMDSYARPSPLTWPELCVGLCIMDISQKSLSSREGMRRTHETSPFYAGWMAQVAQDILGIPQAIADRNFEIFGAQVESNALRMHALMMSAWPSVCYSTPATWNMIHRVWAARRQGLPVYFTQDAGPNIKLLFLKENIVNVQTCFPEIQVIMPMLEEVILVDEHDQEVGIAEKMQAHVSGQLHRAFSVFIFHKETQRILLQQRAQNKYHCGGLWTNTCCSHPRPGERIEDAAQRRLKEEMGIEATLHAQGHFQYRAEFSNGLIEQELDHVFIGEWMGSEPIPINPTEVMAYQWIERMDLERAIQHHPEQYTPWLILALQLIPQKAI